MNSEWYDQDHMVEQNYAWTIANVSAWTQKAHFMFSSFKILILSDHNFFIIVFYITWTKIIHQIKRHKKYLDKEYSKVYLGLQSNPSTTIISNTFSSRVKGEEASLLRYFIHVIILETVIPQIFF